VGERNPVQAGKYWSSMTGMGEKKSRIGRKEEGRACFEKKCGYSRYGGREKGGVKHWEYSSGR